MPRAPQGTSTKQLILDTAIDLFARHGFSAVSVRDLTRSVGIKESSLYKHFKSKDEILELIFAHFENELAKVRPPENLPELVRTLPPEQILRAALRRFLERADTPHMAQIYRIITIEQFRSPRARDLMLGLYEQPLAASRALFGMLSGQDPEAEALATSYQYALHALVAQYSLSQHHERDTAEILERIDTHIHLMSRLLSDSRKENAHEA